MQMESLLSIENYNPETCITAKEFRDMGVELPQNIPDWAWIGRTGYVVGIDDSRSVSGNPETGQITIHTRIRFTQSFRYISLTVNQNPPHQE